MLIMRKLKTDPSSPSDLGLVLCSDIKGMLTRCPGVGGRGKEGGREGGREGGDVKLKLLTWDTGVERGERYAGDNLTLSYFDLEFY